MDYLIFKRRWQGWIKDMFLNGAVYCYSCAAGVPEAMSLEAKTALSVQWAAKSEICSLMDSAYWYPLSKDLGVFSDTCNMLQKKFILNFLECSSNSVTLYIQENIHLVKLRDPTRGYIFFLSAVDTREHASPEGTYSGLFLLATTTYRFSS